MTIERPAHRRHSKTGRGANRDAVREALAAARAGRPVIVDVAIDYSRKTHFTRGVVKTTLWRLPWPGRLRMLGRAASRHLAQRFRG